LYSKGAEMDTIKGKRKLKRKSVPNADCLLEKGGDIDKKYSKKPSIYAGSEEKMLNLVVEIVVKIILKEIL
jgi:hypothetical protein